MVRASAPGKLMLAGEYAVAEGVGPALAVAVDRRVTVVVTLDGKGWRVTSADLGLEEAEPDEVPVVAAVLGTVDELPATSGHILIDSALGVGADKPGLGGSAAICVALMGALHHLIGAEPPTLPELVAAHQAAQGGRGSGYDVATALRGGVVLFEPSGEAPSTERLPWPAALHRAALFTGQGASTPAMLQRLEQWRTAKPEEAARRFAEMGDAARAFVAAFRNEDLNALLDASAVAQELLIELDRTAHIGVRGGKHAELLSAVEDAGALARSAGAGGGDCVWALSDDPEDIEAAVSEAQALGFERLDVAVSEEGLRVEELQGEDGDHGDAGGGA
jgi:phosphomevalonate kinase